MPTTQSLIQLLEADLESGVLDYDDPKWDAWPFEELEQACMDLGIA
jgi:hypothetical protein